MTKAIKTRRISSESVDFDSKDYFEEKKEEQTVIPVRSPLIMGKINIQLASLITQCKEMLKRIINKIFRILF